MSFEVKKILFFGLVVFAPLATGVAAPPTDVHKKVNEAHESVKRMEIESQELMSDAIDAKSQINIQLEKLYLDAELENEENMYPADDLYGVWSSARVNPYTSVEVPDSFVVDVSSYVAPTEGHVTSPFGPRKRRYHYGIDLKVQVGDTIKAAFDGKIRVKDFEKRGYGYYLVIRHNNGLETVYGHLSGFIVDIDETVRAGQPIALGGNTGRSSGPHLHFETRFLGIPINPSHIIDFQHYVPHQDLYVFSKTKSSGGKYQKGTFAYHRVKKGDTLGKIAARYGISVKALCKLNNIKEGTVLRAGSSLRCS